MLRRNYTLLLLVAGAILSGCTTPLLESPHPIKPGEIQVGLYSDMTSYQGGLGLVPTGIILRTGITENTSISMRASLYGAGMDVKRSFGKRAIAFGFNAFLTSFLFDTTNMSAGWTWVHATWIMSSKKQLPSYDAYLLMGPYAFLPLRDPKKSTPWGFRVAIGISSKNLSLVNVVMEYGFLLPIYNYENPLEEYYGNVYLIPYGAVGFFFSF